MPRGRPGEPVPALETLARNAAEARRRGHRHFLGSLCKRGHDSHDGRSLRLVLNHSCLTCLQLRSKGVIGRVKVRPELAVTLPPPEAHSSWIPRGAEPSPPEEPLLHIVTN